ncbi:unnamed protein product [Paramecium octaurelia]|uniref:Uncharacterized protein n=1 Tax=Paramecium octaurelia TaxID=43137 RepID=A0A8S1VSY9_PAROT|nr:unnamed protein product [Paramecium octaurelia]
MESILSKLIIKRHQLTIQKMLQMKAGSSIKYQILRSIWIVVQVAEKVKGQGADKLKYLCDDILDNVSDNMSFIRKQEDKRREIFERQISSLQKDLQQVQSDKSIIDAGLEYLDNQISMGQNDLADYNAESKAKNKPKKIEEKNAPRLLVNTNQVGNKMTEKDNQFPKQQDYLVPIKGNLKNTQVLEIIDIVWKIFIMQNIDKQSVYKQLSCQDS